MTVLRPAISDDAIELAKIHILARQEAMPWLPNLHPESETIWWIRNVVLSQQQVWVAEEDGTPAGFAAIQKDMLEHLYVLPDYQGCGIGSLLLTKAIEIAQHPLRLWTFQRNVSARTFYERRGFEAILFTEGTGNEEKEPDVLYRLRKSI